MRSSITAASRGTATVALATSAVLLGATMAAAQEPPPEPEGGVTEQMRRESVVAFDPADGVRTFDAGQSVRAFDAGQSVRPLGDVDQRGQETVISLSSDLLFEENSWDLPPNASTRVEELLSDVPQDAEIEVVGHTDSQQPIGQDFDNQELSENRADAVAQAIQEVRPDLDLDVSGVGDTDPAEAEDPEDPSTYAANRRVEISYSG